MARSGARRRPQHDSAGRGSAGNAGHGEAARDRRAPAGSGRSRRERERYGRQAAWQGIAGPVGGCVGDGCRCHGGRPRRERDAETLRELHAIRRNALDRCRRVRLRHARVGAARHGAGRPRGLERAARRQGLHHRPAQEGEAEEHQQHPTEGLSPHGGQYRPAEREKQHRRVLWIGRLELVSASPIRTGEALGIRQSARYSGQPVRACGGQGRGRAGPPRAGRHWPAPAPACRRRCPAAG